MTRNQVKKHAKRYPEYFDAEDYSEENAIESNNKENLIEKLHSGLNMISENDKSILLLKYQNNLSIKHIEEVLGIGKSAVKMRIKRAKEKLAISCALI